jgi:hypothetical protein
MWVNGRTEIETGLGKKYFWAGERNIKDIGKTDRGKDKEKNIL